MSKETGVSLIGLWVILLQTLIGFPGSWKAILFVLTGLGLIVLGLSLRSEALSRRSENLSRGEINPRPQTDVRPPEHETETSAQ